MLKIFQSPRVHLVFDMMKKTGRWDDKKAWGLTELTRAPERPPERPQRQIWLYILYHENLAEVKMIEIQIYYAT